MIKNASIATLAMFLSAASPAMATSDAHSLYVNLELALNQTTVGTVIRSISEQTGYEFSYDETLLNILQHNAFLEFFPVSCTGKLVEQCVEPGEIGYFLCHVIYH